MIDSTRTSLAEVTVDTKPAKRFASWWARDIVRSPHCTLSASARALLMLLAGYVDADYWCRPAVDELAIGLGRCDRTVQRALAELKDASLVVIEYGPGRKHTNRYWLPVAGVVPQVGRQPARRKARSAARRQISTKVTPVTPIRPRHPSVDIHKGDTSVVTKVTPVSPEVDNEVSREHRLTGSPESTPAAPWKWTPYERFG